MAKEIRCGMVSIIGRPNVGKSTLLNEIVGEKVAIVSKVPQTTRNQVRGIYNDKRGQIVFIDTPGWHKGKDKLDKFMNKASVGTMHEADCIIHLVDTSRRIGAEEEAVINFLKTVKEPIILGLNKVDLKSPDFASYIELWEEAKGKPITEIENLTMIALSSKEGSNVDELIEIIFSILPEGPRLYPEDIICDVPQKMAISDVIREKLFRSLKQEIPHSIGVILEEVRPIRGKTLMIKSLIMVERNTQKEIVIGKDGAMLKKIGSLARADLEDMLETKIYLECHVKVQKGWRDDYLTLQELGYQEMV